MTQECLFDLLFKAARLSTPMVDAHMMTFDSARALSSNRDRDCPTFVVCLPVKRDLLDPRLMSLRSHMMKSRCISKEAARSWRRVDNIISSQGVSFEVPSHDTTLTRVASPKFAPPSTMCTWAVDSYKMVIVNKRESRFLDIEYS